MQSSSVFTAPMAVLLAAVSFVPGTAYASSAGDSFEGFTRIELRRQSGTHATLANGQRIGFDGIDVRRFDANANDLGLIASIPIELGSSPMAQFPSFVALSTDGATAFVGRTACNADFSFCDYGDAWFVDLTSGAALCAGPAPFNFDAAFADATTVYLSAKPCGLGCPKSSIFRATVGVQGLDHVALIPGSSGPVEVDLMGNLLVGTVSLGFIPPQGSTESVLLFPAADLFSGALLRPVDALVLASGLVGARDLAIDRTTGDVLLAVNRAAFVGGVDQTINRVQLLRGTNSPILFEGELGNTISKLEIDSGDGVARLFGFQPASGGSFRFESTEFVTFTRVVREYTPVRPTLRASASAGTATLEFAQGGASNVAIVLYGPASALLGSEVPVLLPTLSHAPFFVGVDLQSVVLDINGFVLDGAGAGAQTFSVSPTLPPNTYAAQGLVLDGATSLPVGTTNVALL